MGRAKDCSKSAALQKYFSEMFTPASFNCDRLQLTCTPNYEGLKLSVRDSELSLDFNIHKLKAHMWHSDAT